MVNSFEVSCKENIDLFDIFVLAKEEKNQQIIIETFENYKKVKLRFMKDGQAHKIYPKDYKKETIKESNNIWNN